jgi:hypothetical protein
MIKNCITIVLAVLFLSVPVRAQSRDLYSVKDVARLMRLRQARPYISTGFSEKMTERLGDRAAVALLKIYGKEGLKQPSTLTAALGLIREAFSYPNVISNPEDKKPDVTLLLLQALSDETESSETKRDIGEVLDFVKQKARELRMGPTEQRSDQSP